MANIQNDQSSTSVEWKCLEEKIFLDFPYLQIVERLCQKEQSTVLPEPALAHRFYVIRSRDWCNIIPITHEGKIVLVRQFRAGTMTGPYEFPGGVIEGSDREVANAALRELA